MNNLINFQSDFVLVRHGSILWRNVKSLSDDDLDNEIQELEELRRKKSVH